MIKFTIVKLIFFVTFELEGHNKFLTKNYIFWLPFLIFYFPKTKNIVLLKQENVFFHIIFNNKYTSRIFTASPICEFLNVLSVLPYKIYTYLSTSTTPAKTQNELLHVKNYYASNSLILLISLNLSLCNI